MENQIALWEGRVDAIDYQENEMVVQLIDINDRDAAYIATIPLDKVPRHERDLLRLGAVFSLIDRDAPKKNELLLVFRRR